MGVYKEGKRQRNFWKTKAGLENASVEIMIS